MREAFHALSVEKKARRLSKHCKKFVTFVFEPNNPNQNQPKINRSPFNLLDRPGLQCDSKCNVMQIRTTFPTLVALLVVGSCPFSPLLAAASIGTVLNPEQSVPIRKRMPWTTSRVTGSPEPPSPYRTERIFPKLKF